MMPIWIKLVGLTIIAVCFIVTLAIGPSIIRDFIDTCKEEPKWERD